jgi:hypothetical protein
MWKIVLRWELRIWLLITMMCRWDVNKETCNGQKVLWVVWINVYKPLRLIVSRAWLWPTKMVLMFLRTDDTLLCVWLVCEGEASSWTTKQAGWRPMVFPIGCFQWLKHFCFVDSVGMNTDCIASSIWWDGHGKLLVFLTCSIINLKVYEVFHLIIDLKIMSFFLQAVT